MKHGQPLLREVPETWPEENDRDRKLEILFSHADFKNADQEFADVGRIVKMSARQIAYEQLASWNTDIPFQYVAPDGLSWEEILPAEDGFNRGEMYAFKEPEGALDVNCWAQTHLFKINIFLQDPTQSFVAIGNVELEGGNWNDPEGDEYIQTDLKSFPRSTDQINGSVSGGGADQLAGRCGQYQGGWAIRYHWNDRLGRGYFGFDTVEHRYNWADTTCDWLYQEGGKGSFVNPETGEVVETYMCDDRTGGKLPGNASQWGWGGAALIGSSEITEPGWYEVTVSYKIGTRVDFDWSSGEYSDPLGYHTLKRSKWQLEYEEDGVTPKIKPFREFNMRVNNSAQSFTRFGPNVRSHPWTSGSIVFSEYGNFSHSSSEARSLFQIDDIGQSFTTSDYRNCRPRLVINTRVRTANSNIPPGYSYKYEYERDDEFGNQAEYSEATIDSWGLGRLYHLVNPSSVMVNGNRRVYNPETDRWDNTGEKYVCLYETDCGAWMNNSWNIGDTHETRRFKDFVGKIVEPGRKAFEWLKLAVGALVAVIAVQLFYKGK